MIHNSDDEQNSEVSGIHIKAKHILANTFSQNCLQFQAKSAWFHQVDIWPILQNANPNQKKNMAGFIPLSVTAMYPVFRGLFCRIEIVRCPWLVETIFNCDKTQLYIYTPPCIPNHYCSSGILTVDGNQRVKPPVFAEKASVKFKERGDLRSPIPYWQFLQWGDNFLLQGLPLPFSGKKKNKPFFLGHGTRVPLSQT